MNVPFIDTVAACYVAFLRISSGSIQPTILRTLCPGGPVRYTSRFPGQGRIISDFVSRQLQPSGSLAKLGGFHLSKPVTSGGRGRRRGGGGSSSCTLRSSLFALVRAVRLQLASLPAAVQRFVCGCSQYPESVSPLTTVVHDGSPSSSSSSAAAAAPARRSPALSEETHRKCRRRRDAGQPPVLLYCRRPVQVRRFSAVRRPFWPDCRPCWPLTVLAALAISRWPASQPNT